MVFRTVFDANIYAGLEGAIQAQSCEKAYNRFKRHWVAAGSRIPTERSNIFAERGIKIVQELTAITPENLNLRFLLSNKM